MIIFSIIFVINAFGNSQIFFNQKKKTKFPKLCREYDDGDEIFVSTRNFMTILLTLLSQCLFIIDQCNAAFMRAIIKLKYKLNSDGGRN